MRSRDRTDRAIDFDGTATCDLCSASVTVDASGLCELGHRVTSPEVAAAAGEPAPEPATEPAPQPTASPSAGAASHAAPGGAGPAAPLVRTAQSGLEGTQRVSPRPLEPAAGLPPADSPPGPATDLPPLAARDEAASDPVAPAASSDAGGPRTQSDDLRDLLDFDGVGARSS